MMIKKPFSLSPFPGLSHPGIEITGQISVDLPKMIIQYRIFGDIEHILIPENNATGEAYQLWEHTCFECFLLLGNNKRYIELNFSPSGEWAHYTFDDYRKLSQRREDISLISLRSEKYKAHYLMEVEMAINIDTIKQIGLSAVIESNNLSYWALKHTADKPDFHCRDAFTFRL